MKKLIMLCILMLMLAACSIGDNDEREIVVRKKSDAVSSVRVDDKEVSFTKGNSLGTYYAVVTIEDNTFEISWDVEIGTSVSGNYVKTEKKQTVRLLSNEDQIEIYENDIKIIK